MKNIAILLSIILALFTSNKAQNNITVQDTIDVVTSEAFKVPNDKNIVFANLLRFEAKAYILDANLNELREATDYFRNPDQKSMEKEVKGGRGTNVQFHVQDKIDQVGEFYVRIDVKIMSENKKVLERSAYYLVRVSNPHIASVVDLADKYYFSEKKTFSFATQEYLDPNLYEYVVTDQNENELLKGNGPIVVLDTLMTDLNLVGSKLNVKGYYAGKTFDYIENGDVTPKPSSWEFMIEKPNLEEFTDWKNEQKDPSNEAIFISVYNKRAMKVLYTYTGKTESGFVVVKPDIRSLSFRSDPENLIKSHRVSKSGSWVFLVFELDEEYLNSLEQYAEISAKFHVKFRTQFNETIQYDYSATLYK